MTAKNDITGDDISSGSNSTKYQDGWERTFGKKESELVTKLDLSDTQTLILKGAITFNEPSYGIPDGAHTKFTGDQIYTTADLPRSVPIRDTEGVVIGLSMPLSREQPSQSREIRELERSLSEEVRRVEDYHEMADKLADALATLLGVDIGEHSSANCPWENALAAAEFRAPERTNISQVVGETQTNQNVKITFTSPADMLQQQIHTWVIQTFGKAAASDKKERAHRLLEEALELVQACGCTESEAYQLVDYTYSRQAGEPEKEIGDVMLTLSALSSVYSVSMYDAVQASLDKGYAKQDQIRAKWATKPKFGPMASDPNNRQFNFFAKAHAAWSERWPTNTGASWDWFWTGVQWGRAQQLILTGGDHAQDRN